MEGSTGARRARLPRRKGQRNRSAIAELHGQIASRAYQIFEKRGRTHGRDWEDWFRAEQEILSERMDTDLG